LIKKIVIYIIAFICLLFVYRAFLYTGIKKNKAGIFNKYNELFLKEDNHYDVLFIGSSRAEMHFNPKIFDDITGLNSYNMGISGSSPNVSLSLLKVYCKQHDTPKFLIFNVDYFWLQNDTDRLNNFPRYFPYLNNQNLRDELNAIDKRFTSFYYNPLHSLPYTQIDYLSASLHGWLNITGKYDSLMYKGYQTAELKDINLETSSPILSSSISLKNKRDLNSLIEYAKSKSIRMVWVTSPIYEGTKTQVLNKKILANQLEDMTKSNDILYLNYTDSLEYNNPLLFSDNLHLNRSGAAKFSKSISLAFDNILAKKPLFNK